MKYILLSIFLPLILAGACSNSSGPEEVERESGNFMLLYPSVSDHGYDMLNGENTGITADIDLLVSACFFTGARLDSLHLSSNQTYRGGGIVREDGVIAPSGAYPQKRSINFFDMEVLPLNYFVLCRGDSNYAKVSFDSVRTSADTCRAFFTYILNIDSHEREFID